MMVVMRMSDNEVVETIMGAMITMNEGKFKLGM